MGLCSGKLIQRSGSSVDVLESTAWIREVIIHYQKKKKIGITRFKTFTFEPQARGDQEEDVHKVSVEFLDSNDRVQEVHWILRISASTAILERECEVRENLLPALLHHLESREYRRARHLLNIPNTIYIDIKEYPQARLYHLVLEDVSVTKRCKPPLRDLLQGGLDLTHMKVVLATLAQFHAAAFSWRKSLQDDSLLDLHPYLARPFPIPARERRILLNRYERLVIKYLKGQEPDLARAQRLLNLCAQLCDRLDADSLEMNLANRTGGIGLGPISPRDIVFQFTPVPQPLNFSKNEKDSAYLNFSVTNLPICSAITKIGNVCFTSMERDLAVWVFTLTKHIVREFYLLNLIQSYLVVLTNTLELLGVEWEKQGFSFQDFAEKFFQEVPYAVLTSVLVAMQDTSQIELENVINSHDGFHHIPSGPNSKDEKDNNDISPSKDDNEKPNQDMGHAEEELPCNSHIPLTPVRLTYLLHLLDNVKKFV